MSSETPIIQPARTRIWSVPTVLGLILGIVGAVGIIELRPQITVSPQEAIDKSQPFSIPFRITNSGYFSFYVDRVFCYLHSVKAEGVSVDKGTFHDPSWNRFELDRGESKTIIVNLYDQIKPLGRPNAADIAILIDYRPFAYFSHSFRSYFRFTGAYVDNWQWLAQPSSPIHADADRQIEDHMQQIPRSR
jgi:hypothetical protein